MHIVIDLRLSRTSTGRYTDKLVENIGALDTQNQYSLLTNASVEESWKDWLQKHKNFRLVRTNIEHFSFAEQFQLPRLIRSLDPDLVHFPAVQQPLSLGIPSITTILDLTALRFGNPERKPIRFAIKRLLYGCLIFIVAQKSDRILTISRFVKEDLVKTFFVKSSKVTITYLASEPIDLISTPVSQVENSEFVFYTGRALPHKNIWRLIEAHQIAVGQRPGLNLVLSGTYDWHFKNFETRARELGFRNLHFVGFSTDSQLKWMFENAVALIVPSLSEGFGLPGIEGMVHGCPVISSSGTCLPEVYGDAALFFDPLKIDEIAAAMISLCADKALRSELITRGFEQSARYSWHTTANLTLAAYRAKLSKD
jgi:glycosyltransferase involved in cell wall biosynthesis